MIDDSVPEADGIKYSKIEVTTGSAGPGLLGAKPNFKRKKSFWRAYRRGEIWALMDYATKEMLRRLENELYGVTIPDTNIQTTPYAMAGIVYLLRKGFNE